MAPLSLPRGCGCDLTTSPWPGPRCQLIVPDHQPLVCHRFAGVLLIFEFSAQPNLTSLGRPEGPLEGFARGNDHQLALQDLADLRRVQSQKSPSESRAPKTVCQPATLCKAFSNARVCCLHPHHGYSTAAHHSSRRVDWCCPRIREGTMQLMMYEHRR